MTRRFEWDKHKNLANIAKHDLSFETAKCIFDDPILSVIDNRFDYGEERIVSIGRVSEVLILVVVHTCRNINTTRIISARKANKVERSRYEKAIRQ